MRNFLIYLFWPNPGSVAYTSPKVLIALGICALLILGSFAIKMWRRRMENPVTKKLSRSWSAASLWFGIVGVVLIVSRVEGIQFLAMRFMWVLWGIAVVIYLFFQIRRYRIRHYEVLPTVTVQDPREKYLPTKRRH